MPDRPIISVRNLTKSYNRGIIQALMTVSFDVFVGEFVAIVGPSGSGKSTLLNLIGTLDTPTDGDITIQGQALAQLQGDALADFRRAKIGFIFQAFHLIPTLTALENVMMPLLPYRRQCDFNLKKRAADLLDRVGLSHRQYHIPAQLSGGEQQRVAIARALINSPAILLADEPTGNLDSQTGLEIITLLQTLNTEQHLSILIATHDNAVTCHATRMIALKDGRLTNPVSPTPQREVIQS
ncbi:MAG: ABC transporter ATP-binding protein [Anaerolineae bacterium]